MKDEEIDLFLPSSLVYYFQFGCHLPLLIIVALGSDSMPLMDEDGYPSPRNFHVVMLLRVAELLDSCDERKNSEKQ